MVLVQTLVAFIGRSGGKILNAVLGWAVRALFGGASGTQQTLLTILVASAALWPLLLIGVAAPRAAAFLLAFLPIPKAVPENAIRMVWIALALILPGVLGLALATKVPPGTPPESFLTRVARGYPTTLGIAIAFLISLVSIPLLRLASVARRHTDTDVPLVTNTEGYQQVADEVQSVLNARGFALTPCEPRWWVRAPMEVMRALGGAALRHYLPERLVHLQGPDVEVALYSASVLLRGPAKKTTLAHGLIVEALTPLDVFQTTTAPAQELERQIRHVWKLVENNQEVHTDDSRLRSRLDQLAADLLNLEAPFDDWQTVYREVLQLARAVNGEPQLLARQDMESSISQKSEAQPDRRRSGTHARIVVVAGRVE